MEYIHSRHRTIEENYLHGMPGAELRCLENLTQIRTMAAAVVQSFLIMGFN
jgi:hypothetical protein